MFTMMELECIAKLNEMFGLTTSENEKNFEGIFGPGGNLGLFFGRCKNIKFKILKTNDKKSAPNLST